MTDENNQNTTRSRLTLKLSTPVSTQSLAVKTNTEKKLGSSSVQVTIKGRKRDSKPGEDRDIVGLNKNEFEARMRAVSSSGDVKSEIKTHEILSRANKKTQSEEVVKVEEIVVEENIVEPAPVEVKQINVPDYKLDQFDVRGKIRQSVDVANRQKEERENLLKKEESKSNNVSLKKEKSATKRSKKNYQLLR